MMTTDERMPLYLRERSVEIHNPTKEDFVPGNLYVVNQSWHLHPPDVYKVEFGKKLFSVVVPAYSPFMFTESKKMIEEIDYLVFLFGDKVCTYRTDSILKSFDKSDEGVSTQQHHQRLWVVR